MQLEINDVWKSYSVGKEVLPVLNGLRLQMESGEMAAVMGPSGSGKTTLLNVMSGIDQADRGEIRVDGQNLAEMDAAELALFRRRRLGMVFQDYNLLESLTVKENVLLPMILDGRLPEEQDEQAAKMLGILGLDSVRDRSVADLSGGQKQRVAIGRALVNDPVVLLADEPTGNLDARSTRDVMDYFRRINGELGTCVLLVTHDAYAASRCRRVLFLRDGAFAAELRRTGSRSEFLERIAETLTQVGGGQNDED